MHEQIEHNPGLAIIRYVADNPGQYNAQIEVELPAGVSAVFDPACRGAVLERPGQCVVIRCERPTSVRLWPRISVPGQPMQGSVTVKYLTKDQPTIQPSVVRSAETANISPPQQVPRTQPQQTGSSRSSQPSPGFQRSAFLGEFDLLGHLAYRGDTMVKPGQWLGGPDAPSSIEGVMINWPHRPEGVELFLCDPATGQTCRAGDYLGTKGQSRPLRGLEIWLEGPVPGNIALTAEAVFERAGVVRKRGQWIALMGEDASDELTGLKLEIGPETGVPGQYGGDNNRAFPQENANPASQSAQSLGEVPPSARQRTRLFRKRDI